MHILLFCTMLMAATHLRSVSQNFTGSGFLIPSMLRIAKYHSYISSCHGFPPTVKQSGLMLLNLLCGDVAMNPGPVMLGSVNAKLIWNKGPLLADTIASHTFLFLCFTETHIHATDSDSFLHSLIPDGLSLIHRPCSSGIGGGVGFFIRDSYKHRKVDTPNYSSFENIVISVSVSCRTLLLASIYHPPGLCSSILPFQSSVDCNYFICGDFNIHIDVPCTDSHKLKALLESSNLRQSVNNTTHLQGHILDLILSSSDQDVCVHVDICEFISDHAVIKCAIDFPSSLANCQTRISYRRYHLINMSDFRSDLKEMPFVKCPANSVSQLYDQYVHSLRCILDRHAPLVSSLKTKQSADWLSETYRLAKSCRCQFECAWRKDKSQYNRSRLRHQVAWCNPLANRDKNVYYRKLISNNSHDSKELWRELHKVLHRSHGTTLPTYESSKSLADRLPTFFSNKIMKICGSFSSSESCNTVHPLFDPPELTVFTQVTQDEIDKIISKSPIKSCLLDALPTFLIKECIDILLTSITKLVNCSLCEGLVPDGFKKAVVTPLIKKASLPVEDLKNYHSVSGLSFISKLVEHVAAKQLVDHIHRHGLDNSYQSAYQSGHSMETALLSIKMIFICHYLGVKLLPWYFWISLLSLIRLIIPLFSAVFWIGLVLVALL